jgi:hypothetical protein
MPPLNPNHQTPPHGRPALPYNPTTMRLRVCPDCAGPLIRSSACVSCAHCGWGRCG